MHHSSQGHYRAEEAEEIKQLTSVLPSVPFAPIENSPMRASIFTGPVHIANPLNQQSSVFCFAFARDSRRFLLHISPRKWQQPPGAMRIVLSPARCVAEPASYGGWDDLRFAQDPVNSGESAQLRRFLVSVGFDDKRYFLVFVFGILTALAVTRVRISSVVIFPASVLFFAVGFSIGLVRGGIPGDVVSGSKKRPNEEGNLLSGERSKILVDFFDGFDARVNQVKNNLQKAIDSNRVSLGELQDYVREIELITLSASKARDAIGALVGSSGRMLNENAKTSKKRKELGEVVSGCIGGLFGESLTGSNANRSKSNPKQDNADGTPKDHARGSVPHPMNEERILNSNQNTDGNWNSGAYDFMSSESTSNRYQGGERRSGTNLRDGNVGLNDRGGFSYRHKQVHEGVYMKSSSNYETRTWRSQENLLDSADDLDMKNMEAEASFVKEQWDEKSSRSFTSENIGAKSYNKAHRADYQSRNINSKEDFLFVNDRLEFDGDFAPSTSSRIADDVVFDRYLTEANGLLKRARELVKMRSQEDHAEAILYKSAEILARATTMKPMSLLAVGQLGNTYLLHGELKLRMSRDLRTVLSSNEPLSFERHGGGLSSLDYNASRKDKIATALVGVCEECEELLMEAGRKYRVALSIDGNDVRALYNWGLALSFRAQLIADIGPEAAHDADRVFMAAIDKFDAMMSKGNVYAPDALFRWGVVLQQRSRLRPRNSKEKAKLLEQAKRLYEDALDMNSDNTRVKEALSSCVSELRYRNL